MQLANICARHTRAAADTDVGGLHYVNGGNIAIVGVSCRLPGGIADMNGLWDALVNGRDLVGTVPSDRFDPDQFIHPDPKKPGKIYTNALGVLENIAGFDADFFGLSPREASRIDPSSGCCSNWRWKLSTMRASTRLI